MQGSVKKRNKAKKKTFNQDFLFRQQHIKEVTRTIAGEICKGKVVKTKKAPYTMVK